MSINHQKQALSDDAKQVFESMLTEIRVSVDQMFAKLLACQWLFAIGCAYFVSPLAWNGASSSVHVHVWSAILLGGVIVGLPIFMAIRRPGLLSTRLAIASGQLMLSSLLVHLMGGRIEAHFHVFVSFALLAAYRDRRIFIPAVAIAAVDHIVRGYLWPQSVFGVFAVQSWRPFEHIAWVAFEVLSLSCLIGQGLSQCRFNAELQCALRNKRDELESKVAERTTELQDVKIFQECILDSIDAEICVLDEEGRIVYVNERWREFCVSNGGDLTRASVGVNYFDICERDNGMFSANSRQISQAIRDVRDGKFAAYVTEYPCHHDGRHRWFHIRVNPIQLSTLNGIALVHIEVTETKKAQVRAESLAKLVLNSPDEVYIFSTRTLQFVEVNHGACKNLGYDRDQLLQMSPDQIKPLFTREQLEDLLSGLVRDEEETLSFETTHQRKDGSTYRCSLNIHKSVLEDEEVLVAFVTDITQRNRLEEQLAQAQKLESVGQLAAGVAHEINTPMQCVFGNVEFLQTSFEKLLSLSDHVITMLDKSDVDWSKEKEILADLREKYRYDFLRQQTPIAIQEAAEASTKVISIIRAMKIMSHPGSIEKTSTDIHDMIRNAATITRGRWKYVAETVFDFDPNLHAIDVLPAEISQVFINMIVNAADAICEKIGEEPSELGTIKISTAVEKEWVRISFSDTGTGMSESVRKRVFDPFFTTKDVGKGTGQGLAISHNVVVKHHSGKLDVESVQGSGTTFTIRVPRFATREADVNAQRKTVVPTFKPISDNAYASC